MNFDSISEEFQTDKTYLNNASVSVMPKTSIEAMKQFLIDYSEMGPDSPESEIFIKELWEKTRTSIAKVVKCNPDEIIITEGRKEGRKEEEEKTLVVFWSIFWYYTTTIHHARLPNRPTHEYLAFTESHQCTIRIVGQPNSLNSYLFEHC